MAKQSLQELGFSEKEIASDGMVPENETAKRQSQGFIAGTGQRERRAAPGQELPPMKRGH